MICVQTILTAVQSFRSRLFYLLWFFVVVVLFFCVCVKSILESYSYLQNIFNTLMHVPREVTLDITGNISMTVSELHESLKEREDELITIRWVRNMLMTCTVPWV